MKETIDKRVFLVMMGIVIAGMSYVGWNIDRRYHVLPDSKRLKAAPVKPFYEPNWYYPIDSVNNSKDVVQ